MKKVFSPICGTESLQPVFDFLNEELSILLPFYKTLLILMSGQLGAGKTTFLREFLRPFSGDSINSPTYSYYNQYDTSFGKVMHVDFYRIINSDDLLIQEILSTITDYSLVFIEWWEKVPSLKTYNNCILIQFTLLQDDRREITIEKLN